MELAEIFSEQWLASIGRMMLNIAVVFVLGRFIYYPRRNGSRQYLFTYISTSTIIFIVCILLSQVQVELGIALGLFAVFSVIRFRTVQASPRELSYLFVSLGLALMNALVPFETPFIRLLVNNLLILAIIWVADYFLFQNRAIKKEISYDRLDLIDEAKRSELELDLKTRFGISHIKKIQVGDIDTLKGRVKIRVWILDQDQLHFQDKQ
jgi:hypothetical protein